MAKKVVITTDSTCDLSPELAKRFDIGIIPLTVLFAGESHLDDGSITSDRIFERYRADGTLPKTAAPGVQQFEDFFESYTRQGFEVVHIDLSAELSSTYSTASLVAGEMDGVYTVDSRSLTTGIGLLALEGARCRDEGMSAAEIAAHLTELRDKVDVSFVLDTLEFMWKGGRCSGVAALGANLLKLKPAIEMNDGTLAVYKKYRGNIKAVYKQYIRERLSGRKIRPERVFITDSGEVDEQTITELAELVRELTGAREIYHTTAGCTVDAHCGPGTLGVLFINE